uniref:Uncharacterized protein n=1 Tax=Chaetoceros debilis TaxID=122233 RepID=A0A7S3QBH0_9STRA
MVLEEIKYSSARRREFLHTNCTPCDLLSLWYHYDMVPPILRLKNGFVKAVESPTQVLNPSISNGRVVEERERLAPMNEPSSLKLVGTATVQCAPDVRVSAVLFAQYSNYSSLLPERMSWSC